jgi:hypothetical protein
MNKAISFYISKELEANSKWLIKNKRFTEALKVLEAAKNLDPKNVSKLERLKVKAIAKRNIWQITTL